MNTQDYNFQMTANVTSVEAMDALVVYQNGGQPIFEVIRKSFMMFFRYALARRR